MRKLILLFVFMLTVVFVNAQINVQVYTLNATVEKYIEVKTDNRTVDLTATNAISLTLATPEGAVYADLYVFDVANNVYANCPFQIYYTGTPTLSRNEKDADGNDIGGVDELKTYITIINSINDYQGTAIYNSSTGFDVSVVNFAEAPHNGEVSTRVMLQVELPTTAIDWNSGKGGLSSADAGLYTATFTATYVAIN